MNNKVLGLAVGIAIVLSLVATYNSLTNTTSSIQIDKVGANPGPDKTEHQTFMDNITVGGKVFATSSAGSVTYTAANLDKVSLVQHTATGALTATLPASSTIQWIPKPGDRRTIFVAPITTNITLAAGTGTDLNNASTTKVMPVNGLTQLDFVRKANTDIEVVMYQAY